MTDGSYNLTSSISGIEEGPPIAEGRVTAVVPSGGKNSRRLRQNAASFLGSFSRFTGCVHDSEVLKRNDGM